MVDSRAYAYAIKELFDQIDCLHISYLQADESLQKIERRKKLENCIRKYLCLVAHGRKFRFPETAEILHHSVEMKENFSGYRASFAWNAIARYAANLVAQPWRKEFRVIKTFSGFYMHDIEENLVRAELLLNHMGYRQISHSVLVLEEPLDIDAVMEVSRDAIVAFVECQILKEIWEGVSHIECSWFEILDFRENHVGTPEDAIKSLIYRSYQNRFRQQQQQQQLMSTGIPLDPYCPTSHFHHHPAEPSCMYGQVPPTQPGIPCYGYQTYPSYTMPAQPQFANLVSPQQIMAPPGGYPISPMGYHHTKTPIEMYPTNGYHYSHPAQMMPAPAIHNGFIAAQSNATLPSSYGCVVPTGQLIELDSSGPSLQPSQASLTACSQKPLPDDLQSLEMKSGNSNDRTNDVFNEGGLRRERPADLYASVHRTDPKCSRPNTLEDLKRRNGTLTDRVASPSGEDAYARVEKHTGARQSSIIARHHGKKGITPAQTSSMQEGTGTYETWDYVYRNLESQGYNKDVGERGDILHSPANAGHRGSADSGGSSHSVNDNYIHNSRNAREVEVSVIMDDASLVRPVNITNALQQLRLDNNGLSTSSGKVGVDTVDSRGSMYDNASPKKLSPHRDKTPGKMTSASRTLPREIRQDSDKVLSTTLNTRTMRSVREPDIKENLPIWECITCTFHNLVERDVCEMCGKSRQPGPEEKPLISGGRECPKCTLVNKRGVVSCEACNESLKDSPTYI